MSMFNGVFDNKNKDGPSTGTAQAPPAIVSNPTKTGFFNDVIGGVLGGPQKASLLDKVNAHAAQ